MTSGSPGGSGDVSGLRVLHVVQKFSSGVGSAIAEYTRTLPEAEHHLLSGTPVDAEGDLAEQAVFRSTTEMTGSHRAKVRRVREVVRELRPDVVHAHSSHGGVYARLGVARTRSRLVYTPHCYAFERRDISAPVRGAFWLAEALLAMNTSAFAACAPREWQLSAWPTRRAPRHLVPNIAPEAVPHRPAREPGHPLVVGGGRLSPQKDPEFFLRFVERLRPEVPDLRAVWLGDGDPALRAALEAGGVQVSGWLPRAEALPALAAADLYVHSALWEGFPLMVAEATALRVPTLVRRLPTFADVSSGLTLAGEDDVAPAVACLADAAAARANVAGWSAHLELNTAAEQRTALIAAYGGPRARRDVSMHLHR
ncbi:Glycosyltransferase involved in cell wall bisynthesis [Blastococcus aggregatus]|uniref:Glycosyltransferase involved in cell wall bisynthesis n=1 Tax=Blastococcus aggregatus TaxID=38502 RepID=A0A285V106_9ACTN|nr:glycosyltransferase family 4 protein [Blastococcus aggregatus]SOC47739.1 Glycosyltransferase involved in cell wall bisynthesis [Blastococcus aggregatus]